MEDKTKNSSHQFIGCTVESCKFNECNAHCCSLPKINVAPVNGKNTSNPDESMCASYECDCGKNTKTDNYFG